MKRNIFDEFNKITELWSPKIIAEVNDSFVKLAKIDGDLVWHTHEHEDELFIVMKGSMTIKYMDKEVKLNEGDFHVVKKGQSHFPVTEDECWVLLVENKSTKHTGDINESFTKSIIDQLF